MMTNGGYATVAGWCVIGDALNLIDKFLDNSIDLVLTSPPYSLQKKKEYGNVDQEHYVDWFCKFAQKVYQKLSPSGSFVIDIGGAYKKGELSYSLYQFRLLIALCDRCGFELAQPFYWHNTSALPSPIEWVNIRKLRAKNSVETCWWLVKDSLHAKADITKVLVPYSDSMKKLFKCPEAFMKKKTYRPSGHVIEKKTWLHDNGGAIPSNLIKIPNSESNSSYLRMCKLLNVKRHPARFPAGLPEFFIKFLTNQGDLVVDIFSGSNTTGFVAESLKRRWASFELVPEYVAGSSFRFIKDETLARKTYHEIMDGNFVKLNVT